MQIERTAQKVESVMDGLMNLFDARPRQAIGSHRVAVGGLARAEEAVAPGVFLDPHELRFTRARAVARTRATSVRRSPRLSSAKAPTNPACVVKAASSLS